MNRGLLCYITLTLSESSSNILLPAMHRNKPIKERTKVVFPSLFMHKYISLNLIKLSRRRTYNKVFGFTGIHFQICTTALHSLDNIYREDKVIIPLISGGSAKSALFSKRDQHLDKITL